MRTVIVILIVFITIVFSLSICVYAENANNTNISENIVLEQENIILEQIEKINLEELRQEVNKINKRVENILPQLNVKELILAFVRGDLEIKWRQIFSSLLKYLGKEVTANLHLLGQIIILAVVSAILGVFRDFFSSQTISKTANILIFLVLAVLILQSFQMAISIGIQTVNYMVSFMQSLLPILLTLLVSMGAVTSAAIFQPITFLIISVLTTVIKNFILPLIFISVVLNVVDNISDEFHISRLSGLFKEISLGGLGLILIILIGGLLLQGGAAALTDSLSLRTAKYLTGTFIPVIGGIFSDAVDLIVSCSLIIKNALNIFAVLAILLIIAYPVIKIIALILIYKVASALLQPICNTRLVDMLDNLGNSLVLVFLVVITVAFMFLLVITAIVGTANLSVMMR